MHVTSRGWERYPEGTCDVSSAHAANREHIQHDSAATLDSADGATPTRAQNCQSDEGDRTRDGRVPQHRCRAWMDVYTREKPIPACSLRGLCFSNQHLTIVVLEINTLFNYSVWG